MNLKKIVMLGASALMLCGVGTTAIATQSQTAHASVYINDLGETAITMNEAYERLHSAGLVTQKMTAKGPVKIHWYKTAHVKPLFNNVNTPNGWDVTGLVIHWGNGLIIGNATVNGRKYYVSYNEANQGELINGEDLHRPTIMHGKDIIPYSGGGNFDDGYNVGSLAQSVTYEGNQSYIVPTHHNAVKLPCGDDNQEHEFVPVYRLHGRGDYGPEYILKSDFDKLKAGTVNGGKVAIGSATKVWNKNGLAYSSEAHDKQFTSQKRRVNRILKGHKVWGISKKTLRNDILTQIKDSSLNLKETGMTNPC